MEDSDNDINYRTCVKPDLSVNLPVRNAIRKIDRGILSRKQATEKEQ